MKNEQATQMRLLRRVCQSWTRLMQRLPPEMEANPNRAKRRQLDPSLESLLESRNPNSLEAMGMAF